MNASATVSDGFHGTAKDFTEMLNLKTCKHFNAPRCESSRQTGSEESVGHILHGSPMTRGGFLKGILASGIAPSITLGAIANSGSANASVGGMMRNVGARQAAMFGEKNPYDREVNYLQSKGSQFIDTNYSPDGYETVLIEFYFLNIEPIGSYVLLGSSNPNTWMTTGYIRWNVENIFDKQNNTTYVLGVLNTVVFNQDIAIANGVALERRSVAQWTVNEKTLFMFSCNGRTELTTRLPIKRVSITKGGRVVRDWIAVVKDNVGYMFDKCRSICPLTGTSLYANAGTGAFTWG